MSEDKWWESDPYATAADVKASASGGKANTTPQDRIALNAASTKAQTERDAMKDYAATEQAVRTMNTGPMKAWMLDAVTPSEQGGFWDAVGGVVGTPIRELFTEQATKDSRDLLNTVAARNVTRGQALPPGPASDKDVAMARTASVNPYKSVNENLRIIGAARRDSGLEQARALVKSKWIARFGSLSSPSPNGMTHEQAQQIAERDFMANETRPRPKGLPAAPPSTRRKLPTGGWTIRKVK